MKSITTFIITLLILGFILYVPVFGWHKEITHGEHTGYVTAVERSGIFFKTFRIYFKTDLESSQENSYCVVDSDVYSQLEKLAQQKTQVTISYFSWFISGIKSCAGEDAVVFYAIPSADIAKQEENAKTAISTYEGNDPLRIAEIKEMKEAIKQITGREPSYFEITQLLKDLGKID